MTVGYSGGAPHEISFMLYVFSLRITVLLIIIIIIIIIIKFNNNKVYI